MIVGVYVIITSQYPTFITGDHSSVSCMCPTGHPFNWPQAGLHHECHMDHEKYHYLIKGLYLPRTSLARNHV